MGQAWGIRDIPPQLGRTVIVTGTTSGIGFETALELGRAGAHVILASRDRERGERALGQMKARVPDGNFETAVLDVASQASVRAFAASFLKRNVPLDVLINNAGIMMTPTRELSPDGLEMQFATNHLGPFMLTGLLLPALQRSDAPRVVAVSSLMHWASWMRADAEIDFTQATGYSPKLVYANSKLCNLLFTHELSRRHPWLRCVAAHPGGTSTNLQKHAFAFMKPVMQSPASGALPVLRAATDPDATQGAYYGPVFTGFGAPVRAWERWIAKDEALARVLWSTSEKATGVNF